MRPRLWQGRTGDRPPYADLISLAHQNRCALSSFLTAAARRETRDGASDVCRDDGPRDVRGDDGCWRRESQKLKLARLLIELLKKSKTRVQAKQLWICEPR